MLEQYQAHFAAFFTICLFAWIAADYRRAFRRKAFMLDLDDALSPHFLAVFKRNLRLGRRGVLEFRVRYYLWPVFVVAVLAVVSLIAILIPEVGTAIEGLLPQFYSEIRRSSLEELYFMRVAVVSLLLFAAIRIPGDIIDDTRTEASKPTSAIRRALAFYGRARDFYIEMHVLKGKRKNLETNLMLDIDKHRLMDVGISEEARQELFDDLKEKAGQPDAGTEHQILIGYMRAYGINSLDNRLRRKLAEFSTEDRRFRQEIRRQTQLNVELSKDGNFYAAEVQKIGISERNCVSSLNLLSLSEDLPDGTYRLMNIDGRGVSPEIQLKIGTHEHAEGDLRYAVVTHNSLALSDEYCRHVLAA